MSGANLYGQPLQNHLILRGQHIINDQPKQQNFNRFMIVKTTLPTRATITTSAIIQCDKDLEYSIDGEGAMGEGYVSENLLQTSGRINDDSVADSTIDTVFQEELEENMETCQTPEEDLCTSNANDAMGEDHTKAELSTKFYVKLWRLHLLETQVSSNEQNIDREIVNFLRGEKFEKSVDAIIKFLTKSRDKKMAPLVIGLLLVDVLMDLSDEELIQFYNKFNEISTGQDYEQVVKATVLFRCERSIRQNNISSKSVPRSIEEGLQIDYVSYSTETYREVVRTESPLPTGGDLFHLASIQKALIDLKYSSMKSCIDSGSVDILLKAMQLWDHLITIFVKSLLVKNRLSPFKILVSQEMCSVTSPIQCCICQVEESLQVPIVFPPEIVELNHGYISSEKIIKHATRVDVQKFTEMMYDFAYEKNIIDTTTLGIYQLTIALNIRNIKKFIFRAPLENITPELRPDALKILIITSDEDATNIARDFARWMPSNFRSTCLNGLSSFCVVWFLNKIELNIDEIEVFRMMVAWAKNSAREINRLNRNEHCLHMSQFIQIRSALRLIDVIEHYDDLIKLGYVTRSDCIRAKKIKETGADPEGSSEPWFALTPRQRRK